MAKLRTIAATLVRWGWFGLLAMIAFGYLVAGLSQSTTQTRPHTQSSLLTEGVDTKGVDTKGFDAEGASVVSGPRSQPKSKPHSEVVENTIAKVDAAWRATLDEADLTPAESADWLTVNRRLSLSLVGNGLSLEEIRKLEQVPERDRTATHLKNLLRDSRFHHYWGERWTRFLVGTDEGQFVAYRRRRFRTWLTEKLAENRKYDQLVRDLITAKGLWTDRPEVNFYTATFDSNDGSPDPVRLAARTSRAFLGLRIDCLQCHDDFLGNVSLGDVDEPREGLQTDFHQLAAFFTSAKSSGLQGIRDSKVNYQYKYLDEEEETEVVANVPYQPELLPADGNPRKRLAAWITHPQNRQAARSAVSHVWALMFGKPISVSVDNLPLDSESSAILESLTDGFIESGFDLRDLIRMIAGSQVFAVDSRLDGGEVTAEHEKFGAVFPLVRLRPEQVAGAITQAARVKQTDRDSSFLLQMMTHFGNAEFVERYGDVGEDEFDDESITITQRLLMMNGDMSRKLIEANPVLNTTSHVLMFSPNDQHLVETVYLSALNRYPTPAESEHFVHRITESDNREAAIEDMMWVLLNSSELAWNH